jgi:ATP-binding protein involved in chromosome partitioning
VPTLQRANLSIGKGCGKKISEDFGIPFIGEVPLHPAIREGSDAGRPTVVSEPESEQAQSFIKAAKLIAGRISIIAADMKAQEQSETQATEQPKEE